MGALRFGGFGFLSCSLFEVVGAGRVAPRKSAISGAVVETVVGTDEKYYITLFAKRGIIK
jgi:hypothetical protein